MAGPTIYYSNAPTQAVIGASTDTKPTTLPLGSIFWESDTGHKYIFAGGTTWFQDQSSGGGAPTGAAGGDLGGTYPNPTVVSLTHVANTYGANLVYGGPTSGSAATPTFRSLVTADIPTVLPTLTGGLLFSDNTVDIGATGATRPRTGYFGTSLVIQSDTGLIALGAAADATIRRGAAALFVLGAVPSASPIAYSLRVGESSRSGTDTNIAGANATFMSGNGTGSSVGSSLIFQTPLTTTTGTGAQTQTTVLTLNTLAALFAYPIQVGASDVVVQRLGAHSLQLGAAASSSPVSYTLTGGESARGGTDTNTAGGSLTIASGLGTGTGAASSLIFQTPVVGTTGTTAQALATRLTLNAANGVLIPGQDTATPGGIRFTTSNNNGISEIRGAGTAAVRIGQLSSATPTAYTLTIGTDSRVGIDSNVAGANGTLQSGLGTGTGALASLSLASPIAAASGTTAQTYATGLKILVGTAVLTNYIVANLPAAATAGAGATAFVTDGSTTVILGLGQAVTGGGANKVPVYSDGTNWIIG